MRNFPKNISVLLLTVAVAAMLCCMMAPKGFGYSANKVWMEFRDNGRFRVYVNYTVPELKEFREVWVEFAKKKEAESYYFDLVRGADFYMPESKYRSFQKKPAEPTPW